MMKETYQEQLVAENSGCVICGKRPTIYRVGAKGYCGKHKQHAVNARKAYQSSAEVNSQRIDRRLNRADRGYYAREDAYRRGRVKLI